MKVLARFLALFAIALASPVAAQSSFSNIYVYGDSLSDSGNAFLATRGEEASPLDGYYEGRFSNGPNFADYISSALTGTLATPALLGGTNFAVGGATAATISGTRSPSFIQQIVASGALVSRNISPDALVIVNFSGNDVRRTINIGGPVQFDQATSSLFDGLGALYLAGARNFVVTGTPNIGALPRSIDDVGSIPGRLEELTQRSRKINFLFGKTSAEFAQLTGSNVAFFDLFRFENALVANPTRFGLPGDLNTTTPCQIIGGGVPQISNCEGSLYFDRVHPTTAVHQVIADGVLAQLNGTPLAVPEPATWLMMLIGFGVVGSRIRGSRVHSARLRALTF